MNFSFTIIYHFWFYYSLLWLYNSCHCFCVSISLFLSCYVFLEFPIIIFVFLFISFYIIVFCHIMIFLSDVIISFGPLDQHYIHTCTLTHFKTYFIKGIHMFMTLVISHAQMTPDRLGSKFCFSNFHLFKSCKNKPTCTH